MPADEALRIVLVEDNDADAFLIREAIRQSGIEFELEHFDNGDHALRHLFGESSPPGLLLLDLHLPGTDGPEILSAIRGESRLAAMPVIVISGASEDWLKGVDLSRSTSLIHKSMNVDEYMREIGEAVLAFHQPGSCDHQPTAT